MDTLFFWASKLVGLLIAPGSLLLILVTSAALTLWLGKTQLSRSLLMTSALVFLLIAFVPLGDWLIAPLESRFPQPSILPSRVDGIIVLGGSVSPPLSDAWGQPQLNDSAERLTGFLDLAIRYPNARLLFTGGSGNPLQQDFKEADIADQLFYQLGFVNHNIQFERESRNTHENAFYSKDLMAPQQGETWILVTSAYHMPRAVGVFCQQQWPVTAYPVDYYSMRGRLLWLELDVEEHLASLQRAIREWVGLIAYRLSNKSHALLPGPENACQ